MNFTIKKILDKDKALSIIKTTQTNLTDIQEALHEHITWQNSELKELMALPNTPQKDKSDLKEDVTDKKRSVRNVEEKLKRIQSISEQKTSFFFCISKTTTPAEINVLMTEIKHAFENTKDPAKIRFLETVRETAETCKELISQDAAFDDQYIPLLTNDQKYARILITNEQLDALKQSPDINDSNFFSIIKDVYNQAVNSKNMLGLMGNENDFIKTLQAEIEFVINAPSPTSQHTSERLQTTLHTKINFLISRLESNTSFSDEFKKFINHLCKAIKIISPIFKVTEMKEGMAERFRDIKTTLQDNKATQPAIEDIEKDETMNPMHKGFLD
jgi:hypothetical protein